MHNPDQTLIAALEKTVTPVGETFRQYDPIIKAANAKQMVLIGEASHGSLEFYRTRAEITQRLIEEVGFDAVAVEADWPDAYAINSYVRNLNAGTSAEDALERFERFPTWMWANEEVLHFIKWLRAFNDMYHKNSRTVGFYGLDLYNMNSSIEDVIKYLEKIDPAASEQARERYRCLEYFRENPQTYGYSLKQGLTDSCEKEIIAQLIELRKNHIIICKKMAWLQKMHISARSKMPNWFAMQKNIIVLCLVPM